MNTSKIALYTNPNESITLTPAESIISMFEHTDDNGTLYIPEWPYDNNYDDGNDEVLDVRKVQSGLVREGYLKTVTGSYDNETKTDVLKESQGYREVVRMRNLDDDVTGEQIIVRSLKQPTCSDISISNRSIHYTIEKELGIELVGDVKVKIEANEEEDPWDEIIDENSDDKLDDELTDDFIQENPI